MSNVASIIRETPKHSGTVKFWSVDKGYGFILPDEPDLNNGADIFVHISKTGGVALEKGRAVVFDMFEDERTRKVAARNVKYKD